MATQPEVPLTEACEAALRDAVLSYLGIMPFEPGGLISRANIVADLSYANGDNPPGCTVPARLLPR